MRILILSIYSESEIYSKMLELQRMYNNTNINIKYYFIEFRNQDKDFIIQNDFIYINGSEDIMNITDKTLKSMKYILHDLEEHYDFIIRTNISTIINYKKLIESLQIVPISKIYSSGCKIISSFIMKFFVGVVSTSLIDQSLILIS